MNSFAFWYEKTDKGTSKLRATVHFNLFCQCGWKNDNEKILDVGLLMENINCAKRIFFFLPFQIEENRKTEVIEDLGKRLEKNNMLSAVFNESYQTGNDPNRKYFFAKKVYGDDDDKEGFAVYCLDITKDLDLITFSYEGGNGTILSIAASHLTDASRSRNFRCYIRFRIKCNSFDFLVHEYKSPYRALQNTFFTTYMVDFRFNNTRSLSTSLIEEMRDSKNEIVCVNALHFLLITKAYVNVDRGSFNHARIIEHGIWKEYVNDPGKPERDTTDLVAYHYIDENRDGAAEKSGMYPSDLFIQFQTSKSIIKWYILFTILLGAAGSGLIEFLKWLVPKVPPFLYSVIQLITNL